MTEPTDRDRETARTLVVALLPHLSSVHNVGLLAGALADAREEGRREAKQENEWLRRVIAWCRARLGKDPYRHTLDRYLAIGPTEIDKSAIGHSNPLPPLPEPPK